MTTASASAPARGPEEVAAAAEKRMAAEEEKRARLAAGELGLDIYGMRERLAEKGLKYV
jgi:4-hydroxy-4-methyl-2-oxoglutarate aldolase